MERRRIKISPGFVGALAVILLALVCVTAWLNASGDGGDGTSLSICRDGEQIAEYSMSELMGLESVDEDVELESAKDGDESGRFTGVMLDTLLEETGMEGYDTVVLTAGDGYSAAADADETGKVLIAYAKDGDTLGYYADGGQGPMRAVFLEDTYGNRSVKFLTKVDCRD